jgi:hypothetical protein
VIRSAFVPPLFPASRGPGRHLSRIGTCASPRDRQRRRCHVASRSRILPR